ncbi:MAG: hypothetical protein K2N24_04010, partial [Lachnospiraceae bacterium]|nr:hypothetical protein [Lachnospiraceae bacterium]
EIRVIVKNFNMPRKDDTNALLDKCVLLNTYLDSYFFECGYISDYDIYYRLDCFKDKSDLYSTENIFKNECNSQMHNTIFLNKLALENTNATVDAANLNSEYTEYDSVFTNLSENLEKEANGK